MKTPFHSAGASCEDPGAERTVTSILRQLTAEARQWQIDAQRIMLAGDFATALGFFRNALAKAQAAGETELEAELHNSCGCMLSKIGNKVDAKMHYLSAVAILERIYEPGPNEPELLFFSRHNAGEMQREVHGQTVNKMLKEASALIKEGCIMQARNMLEEALPFAEHGAKDPILEAELLNQLAWTYAKEKKQPTGCGIPTGISLLKRALALIAPFVERNETADKLTHILDKNLEHFQEVERERPVWLLLNEADGFISTNVHEHCEAAASKAAAVYRKKLGADHHLMAYALNRLGYSQLMMHDFPGARKSLRAARVIISKWPDHAQEARVIGFCLAWAEAERQQGDWGILPPGWL
ncbi:MAG: hypothetical protein IAF58_17360 [Leptolyngbya sp.]|nr:hypothetical protein [Candidatus Melainabacteria bacterium]